MKKPLVVLLIPLLTIGALYVTPGTITPAHAAGLVGLLLFAAGLKIRPHERQKREKRDAS